MVHKTKISYHLFRSVVSLSFVVEIIWGNQSINEWVNGSWDAYLAPPADFAGADHIITNLAKEREPGIEIMERTP